MKRRIRTTLIFLLLGAIVNVAVARGRCMVTQRDHPVCGLGLEHWCIDDYMMQFRPVCCNWIQNPCMVG